MYCGRLNRARQLYEKARLLAVDLRDQASIAAMLYNKTALAMNWLRVSKAAALEEDVGGAMTFLYSEIDSAKSYHLGAQQTSLSQLLGWMLARRELDAGQLSVAASMYKELVEAGLSHNMTSATLAVKVEYTECLLDLGDKVEAAKMIATFWGYGTERFAFDDELLFQLMKHKANEVLGIESPFAGEIADPTLARQRFCDALERIRGMADDVDAAVGVGLH